MVEGVIPACFVPFTEHNRIHKEGYHDHIARLADHDGISGLLANGHAGESYALSPDERVSVVEIATNAAKGKPVYSGVVGATTNEIINDAIRVQDAGAKAVMVDTPSTPIHGRPAAVKRFYKEIVEAVDVPIVLFQIAAQSGRNYSPNLLAELATIDGIVAIKEGVWDYDLTKADKRALRNEDVDVNYLMGNDEHLFPCYSLGVDGTVVELAAAIPDYICELYTAVEENDLQRAREIDRKLEPFLEVIYQQPKHDSSIRLKCALESQGHLPTSTPREPALPLPDSEVQEIHNAHDQLINQ